MTLKKRVMSRENWLRVPDRDYTYMEIEQSGFQGIVGLLHLKHVTEPHKVQYEDISINIIDNGYYWLQIAEKDANYWVTVMYNSEEEVIQYYIDMTDGNILLDHGKSYFYDLFLDVVIMPDGKEFLLDEDELEQALLEKVITKEQYDRAYETSRMVMNKMKDNLPEFMEFCDHCYKLLRR